MTHRRTQAATQFAGYAPKSLALAILALGLIISGPLTVSATAASDTEAASEAEGKTNDNVAAFQTEKAERLDALFAQLQSTRSSVEAGVFEREIWGLWMRSGDPKIDAKLQTGTFLMQTRRSAEAMEAFDNLIADVPDYAEAWNKRATLHYMVGNYESSLADIAETLAREPRHFGALAGEALIYLAQDEKEKAVDAIQRTLAIHPHMRGAEEMLRRAGATNPEKI